MCLLTLLLLLLLFILIVCRLVHDMFSRVGCAPQCLLRAQQSMAQMMITALRCRLRTSLLLLGRHTETLPTKSPYSVVSSLSLSQLQIFLSFALDSVH